MSDPGSQRPQGESAGGFFYLLTNAPFILLHVSLVAALFVPFAWWALALCALTYLVWMFGITAGYHRDFAHHSCKTAPAGQADSPHETTFRWSHFGWVLSSANQGFFWCEVDIRSSALVVLSWFGTVWGLRTPGEKAIHHRLIEPAAPPADATLPSTRSAAHAPAEAAETA